MRRLEGNKPRRICPSCGEYIEEGSLYCSRCGFHQKQQELTCSQCGEKINLKTNSALTVARKLNNLLLIKQRRRKKND